MEAGQVTQTQSDVSYSTLLPVLKKQGKHNTSARNANQHLTDKPCIFCKDIHSTKCQKLHDLMNATLLLKVTIYVSTATVHVT